MSLSSNIYTSKETLHTKVTKFLYFYFIWLVSSSTILQKCSFHSITYKETQFLYLVFWGKDLYLNPKIQLISSIFDIPVPNLWYAKMFCSFDEGHVVLHPAGTWVGILIPVSCQPMIILSMVSAGILPITAAAAHQHATNVECCDISTFILHSQPNILT